MESRMGETRVARLDAQHDSATGHVFLAGDAQNALYAKRNCSNENI